MQLSSYSNSKLSREIAMRSNRRETYKRIFIIQSTRIGVEISEGARNGDRTSPQEGAGGQLRPLSSVDQLSTPPGASRVKQNNAGFTVTVETSIVCRTFERVPRLFTPPDDVSTCVPSPYSTTFSSFPLFKQRTN